MKLFLKPFGLEPENAPRIRASLDTTCSEIRLTFSVQDTQSEIHWNLSGNRTVLRSPDLWKKTCFEFFIGRAASEIYHEFNFAPEGAWNSYSFKSYREPRQDLVATANSFYSSSRLEQLDSGATEFTVQLQAVHGSRFQYLLNTRSFEFQIAAVIDRKNGEQLLYSTQHPEARPDFHRRELFKVFSSAE